MEHENEFGTERNAVELQTESIGGQNEDTAGDIKNNSMINDDSQQYESQKQLDPKPLATHVSTDGNIKLEQLQQQ